MIAGICGQLIDRKDNSLFIDVNGMLYEVFVPASVSQRVEETKDIQGRIRLVTYCYLQMSPSSGNPMLVGFMNEIEKEFFLNFIKVSGIGPRAAVKALSKPISEITKAIDLGDLAYLKTLPGIGAQKAKEIVAKLQGKMGKFGLIRDENTSQLKEKITDWQEEVMGVLLQLQYKRPEATDLIKNALERSPHIKTTEELLNEIYKQKVKI